MCRVVLLNTTAINIGQLSHLNINRNLDKGEMGVYAHLLTGHAIFLQKTDSFEGAIIKLKEFTQKCNGTYRPPLPLPNKRPPLPEYNPNK